MESNNLDLEKRQENTRPKREPGVRRFSLDEILKHFQDSVQAINAQLDVASSLRKSGKHAEAKNIQRAQIIFLSSTLDFYMHELTKYGLRMMYEEKWTQSNPYKELKVNITMRLFEKAYKKGVGIRWFLSYVNKWYGSKTMTTYKAMADQLKLLGIKTADVEANVFNSDYPKRKQQKKIKKILGDLSARRNIIAHQADRAHTNAKMQGITQKAVKDFMFDITKIVMAIDMEAKKRHGPGY